MLAPGQVCWAWLDPAVGREQGGRRPVVVVSGSDYLDVVDSLVVVVPVTGVDRGWDNHVAVSAAGVSGWAMTEQPRTLSRHRLDGVVGPVEAEALVAIRAWLADFLELAVR
ncbi:hypothetical protein SGUI_2473 [Serinicoccus hydrothermalis]|uniref:Uncharacterized protein n=1 Tax=Serinicoccus hydrothermalis TaxID=1758689 RepID=A0A1B1NEL8_9MICO|nr:hypothetical protein SGUI_2473 [Serinicoccus hydrothermalis]